MSSKMLVPICDSKEKAKGHSKITVVGVGAVGMACAFSIMTKSVASEIALVDVMADKVKGEVLDLQHGQQFTHGVRVNGGTDYVHSANSDIVIVTAGVRQNEGETRLSLVQRNVEIYKKIIPQIVAHNPNCILMIISNPVDLMTYVAQKLSGFPKHRVIGTGTMLDSARFRHLLGEKLGVSPSSVHGYVIGEHGDSSVPVWSSVNIAGVRLSSYVPAIGTDQDKENFRKVHQDVVAAAYDIIKLKGYTSWAIGLTAATLCHAILHNTHAVYPVTTYVKDIHGIKEDVALSVPCLVSSIGLTHIVPQELSEAEVAQLQKSAKALNEVAQNIAW